METSTPASTAAPIRSLSPRCDVYESRDEYLVEAELPGVLESELEIQLDKARLTVSATRTRLREPLRYHRAFEIPDTVNRDEIDAKLADGLLRIHLPKSAQARVRTIQINASR